MQKPPSHPLASQCSPRQPRAQQRMAAAWGQQAGTSVAGEGTHSPNCQPQTAALTWLQSPSTKTCRWVSPSEGGEREHSHRIWMGTGTGVTPPGPLAVPYLAWEVSQQLLDTRVLSQRGHQCSRCPDSLPQGHSQTLQEGPRRDLHLHTLGTWYSTWHRQGWCYGPQSLLNNGYPFGSPSGNRAGGKQDRAEGTVTVWGETGRGQK